MSDWATEKAEQVYDDMRGICGTDGCKVLAAALRAARNEGLQAAPNACRFSDFKTGGTQCRLMSN